MEWYRDPNFYIISVTIILVVALCIYLVAGSPKDPDYTEPRRKRDPHDFYRDQIFEDTEPFDR